MYTPSLPLEAANQPRPLRVFLAEDNRADVYLVEMALQEQGLFFTLHSVLDGEAALKVVDSFAAPEDCPDIALLDRNLPREDGDKVMQAIRESAGCPDIPIVIMSSTQTTRELDSAERFRAVFFRKPSNLTDFLELGALVKTLCAPKN